jgi:hypothetical protein
MKFLDPTKISFQNIQAEVRDWLIDTYAQASVVFSKSSPYGQLLAVMQEFLQLVFVYIEDVVVEMNIYTATKPRSIYGWARLAGHNPTRNLSAQGTLGIKIAPGAEVPLNASYILLLDKTKMSCLANNKKYFIQLGNTTGSLRIDLKDNNIIPIKVIQGELESQVVTGNGKYLQSFSIISKKKIENEMVWVTVNGENYEIVDSLYDMKKGEKLCMVKTGLSGGIDLYFGNEDYGVVPAAGATINVMYVVSDGFEGNLFAKSNSVQWKFLESGFTNTGEEVDLNKVFSTEIIKPIILGADAENPDLTKLIAPKTSRSYVLANPDSYINFLSRFNYSYVDAYTTRNDDYIADDNVVYLFLIPDISRRLTSKTDYFTTNLKNFYLDEDEKNALIEFIDMSGKQIVSTELQVIDPVLTKYALNVYLRIYDTVDQQTLKGEIVSKITDYLLKVNRRDKVPKSDIIALIEGIKGVDSVNISFISETNERAIIDGYYIQRVEALDKVRGITVVQENQIMIEPGDDPNLGLDDFGDIKIGLNEMPVIRGDWYDRYGNYYEDGINYNQFCSLNIVVKDVIRENLAIRMMTSNKDSLK